MDEVIQRAHPKIVEQKLFHIILFPIFNPCVRSKSQHKKIVENFCLVFIDVPRNIISYIVYNKLSIATDSTRCSQILLEFSTGVPIAFRGQMIGVTIEHY